MSAFFSKRRKMDMFQLKRNFVKEFVLVILGNFIVAVGVGIFIIPNNILSGGLAGVAIALYPIFYIEPETMITILTAGFFIFGAIVLGKNFAVKTLLSAITYPIFLNLMSTWMVGVVITENLILASIYGGVIVGLGIGLVFRTGASTGGMDIPPLVIHKYTNIPVATLVMITDALTVLLGVATHSIEAALIGILSVWASGYVINKTLSFGGESSKSIMIISDYHEILLERIHTELDRGATLINAVGGFSRDEKMILLVVIMNTQYPLLNKIVMNTDPNAFIIATDAMEVKGNGFTVNLDDRK